MGNDNDNKGPAATIEIPGFLMVPAPQITPMEALSNFEEVARKSTAEMEPLDRIRIATSIVLLGELVDGMPVVTLDEAVKNFDDVAIMLNVGRVNTLALMQSVKVLRELVAAAKAKEAAGSKAEGTGGEEPPPRDTGDTPADDSPAS